MGAFCVPSSVVAHPWHFLWIWPTRPGLFGLTNTPRRLRSRHGGCISPLGSQLRPKCCFGCVLCSELCRRASVALSVDMANVTRVIWVDEHAQEVAQASRWLYPTARQPVEAKMVFWVRFVFRALSSRVRGTFCGYGQRDQGYLGRRTHPGGCAGVTVAVSHRSAAC